jgi:hypothetical protein
VHIGQDADRLYFKQGEGCWTLEPRDGQQFSVAGLPLHLKIAISADDGRVQVLMTNTERGDLTVYRRIEQADLAHVPEYSGVYESAEANTRVSITFVNGILNLLPKRGTAHTLYAVEEDEYATYSSMHLRFTRDQQRTISGFYLSMGRAKNVHFTKLPLQRTRLYD